MFVTVIIFELFMICSQLESVFFETFEGVKSTLQYTHFLSLFFTICSLAFGMLQLFTIA